MSKLQYLQAIRALQSQMDPRDIWACMELIEQSSGPCLHQQGKEPTIEEQFAWALAATDLAIEKLLRSTN